MRPFALVASFFALAACRNDCQKLCVEMADFAADCGYEVPKEELKACIEEHSNQETPEHARDICAEELPTLREEWTCENIAAYFDDAKDDGGGDDTGG